MPSSEQQLIQEVFAPLAKDAGGAFGLRDDAALLKSAPETDMVVTVDGLAEGVHFFADDAPDLIARKALRMSLSDLAAKGAVPASYLLSLGTPEATGRGWIERFAEGLATDQAEFGCHLLGGDTIRTADGISISITAFGEVPEGGMKQRRGAAPGELIYVTGTVGDGLLGLKVRQGSELGGVLDDAQRNFLVDRYLLPQPRVAFVPAVRKYATAAMDVSDGLAGDLELLCSASEVSAEVDLTQVALSKAAAATLGAGQVTLADLMSGGDDYELLMSVPPNSVYALEGAARRMNLTVSRIGRVVAGSQPPVYYGASGDVVEFARASYSHLG